MVMTFVDITERRRTKSDLVESERRLQLAREANALGIIDYDASTPSALVQLPLPRTLGLGETDPVNLDVLWARVAESDLPKAQGDLRRALEPASGGNFAAEFRLRGPKEQWVRALGKSFTEPGKPERPSRLVATVQDVTEAKAWEAHQVLLLRDLSHRVKNTLTVIMSMARQTLRYATSPAALEKFEERLFALSHAHDLLVQSDWKGAEIGAVMHRVLAAYPASSQGQIAIEGPEFLLPHHVATPFAMLVHELATNAAKYGASARTERSP